MKYIFVAGAPGSKWSSVVKNIYYSPDVDQTDYNDDRTYYHDASGETQLMHLGVYFDPGMEFGYMLDTMDKYTKEELEKEFDIPFSGSDVRIIKSHVFSNHIDFIRKTWPDCPIVLVHRSDDACLGWWVKCGHFDITYPSYAGYYKDLKTMARIIEQQNAGILTAWWKYNSRPVIETNCQLAQALRIEPPPAEYKQNYVESNVSVKVI
jgi:hypothetical protein